jgi:hypothetical protein
MTFRIEGDYVIFDYRRIARLLPNLSLATLRAAEQALHDAELPVVETAFVEPPTPDEAKDMLVERLRALSDKSGGLLSWDEIEDALS